MATSSCAEMPPRPTRWWILPTTSAGDMNSNRPSLPSTAQARLGKGTFRTDGCSVTPSGLSRKSPKDRLMAS
eukprot:CAMPEP_0172910988 /NCGR_PEP_ID=MMETSP1075-20121228/185651_1 /TAXON_ID=2916 /ORGANISM="Ceratium fusus, Strain PA161109" /LENGTH=71 /DNA_ID=CAMNT_0013769213 /DNA_START=133 /DNA_END=351 /DNA_ORIENTATION=-